MDKYLNRGDQCCFSAGTSAEDLETFPLSRLEKFVRDISSQEFRASSNNNESWHWTAGLFYKDATFVAYRYRSVSIRYLLAVLSSLQGIRSTMKGTPNRGRYLWRDWLQPHGSVRGWAGCSGTSKMTASSLVSRGATPQARIRSKATNPKLYLSYHRKRGRPPLLQCCKGLS